MARMTPRRPASIKAAAEYFEVHPRTIYRWINDGLLAAYRTGPRLVRVDLDDLDKLTTRIPAGLGNE